MFLSQSFFYSQKEIPKGIESKSHELMIRANLIYQNSSGLFSYLPMGKRVLKNLIKYISKEMESIGYQEILTAHLLSENLLKKAKRIEEFKEQLFWTKDYKKRNWVLAATHEETIMEIAKVYLKSYKNYPMKVFQISEKYRNEYRPRSGLLRTKEFIMKDAYSLSLDEKEALESYELMSKTYKKIFKELDIPNIVVLGDSKAMGGQYSQEFIFKSEFGDDWISFCTKCSKYKNYQIELEEMNLDEKEDFLKTFLKQDGFFYIQCVSCEEKTRHYFYKGIEIGHIFQFGIYYSQLFDLSYQKLTENHHPYFNSYGIGISRLLSILLEKNHDDQGIIWPMLIAPYHVIIIPLNYKKEDIRDKSLKLYHHFQNYNVNGFPLKVILDDRDISAGMKFKDADLLGIPISFCIGEKEIENNNVQVSFRNDKNFKKTLSFEKLENILKEKVLESF